MPLFNPSPRLFYPPSQFVETNTVERVDTRPCATTDLECILSTQALVGNLRKTQTPKFDVSEVYAVHHTLGTFYPEFHSLNEYPLLKPVADNIYKNALVVFLSIFIKHAVSLLGGLSTMRTQWATLFSHVHGVSTGLLLTLGLFLWGCFGTFSAVQAIFHTSSAILQKKKYLQTAHATLASATRYIRKMNAFAPDNPGVAYSRYQSHLESLLLRAEKVISSMAFVCVDRSSRDLPQLVSDCNYYGNVQRVIFNQCTSSDFKQTIHFIVSATEYYNGLVDIALDPSMNPATFTNTPEAEHPDPTVPDKPTDALVPETVVSVPVPGGDDDSVRISLCVPDVDNPATNQDPIGEGVPLEVTLVRSTPLALPAAAFETVAAQIYEAILGAQITGYGKFTSCTMPYLYDSICMDNLDLNQVANSFPGTRQLVVLRLAPQSESYLRMIGASVSRVDVLYPLV